jgi:putative addiction module killer protein
MRKLKDIINKAHINRRIDRLSRGNPGNVNPIGEGCSEMRIDYGPGYRVYYRDTGREIIIILCGGLNALARSKGMPPNWGYRVKVCINPLLQAVIPLLELW